MKIVRLYRNISLKVLAIIVAGLLTSQLLAAQSWFNSAWQHRTQVTVSNPSGTVLTDYQVQVILNSTNFDLAGPLADGSDIRVTSDDGRTPIPFWIENSWHAAGPDTIWAKVPVIPAGGTTSIHILRQSSASCSGTNRGTSCQVIYQTSCLDRS